MIFPAVAELLLDGAVHHLEGLHRVLASDLGGEKVSEKVSEVSFVKNGWTDG